MGNDKCLDYHLAHLPGEEGMNPPDVVNEESTGPTAAMFGENDSLSVRVTANSSAFELALPRCCQW